MLLLLPTKKNPNLMAQVNKWTGGYIEETFYKKHRQIFKINVGNNEQNTFPFEIRLPLDEEKL